MITGKIFIKKYAIHNKDYFEEALDDFYDGTINLKTMPDDEDLEKMKITLNWIVKNRNKVRTYYLKDYPNKHDLYSHLSRFSTYTNPPESSTFDIKNFLNKEIEAAF